MAESKDRVLLPSVIDRLMKPAAHLSPSRMLEGIGVQELKAAVARDLAWLLNTRMWLPEQQTTIENLDEARSSVLTYGLPDLSIFSWASPQDCKKIAALVERAVRTFEPRLIPSSVRCDIVAAEDFADFSVKLHIEAILHVDPITEHVAFDSAADIEAGGLRIEHFE